MLRELGVESPAHPPQLLTPEMARSATLWVTMGCLDRASCPAFLKVAGGRDWGLRDPGPLPDEEFRAVRDELARRVEDLLTELRDGTTTPPMSRRRHAPT
jgi:arsenate reductase